MDESSRKRPRTESQSPPRPPSKKSRKRKSQSATSSGNTGVIKDLRGIPGALYKSNRPGDVDIFIPSISFSQVECLRKLYAEEEGERDSDGKLCRIKFHDNDGDDWDQAFDIWRVFAGAIPFCIGVWNVLNQESMDGAGLVKEWKTLPGFRVLVEHIPESRIALLLGYCLHEQLFSSKIQFLQKSGIGSLDGILEPDLKWWKDIAAWHRKRVQMICQPAQRLIWDYNRLLLEGAIYDFAIQHIPDVLIHYDILYSGRPQLSAWKQIVDSLGGKPMKEKLDESGASHFLNGTESHRTILDGSSRLKNPDEIKCFSMNDLWDSSGEGRNQQAHHLELSHSREAGNRQELDGRRFCGMIASSKAWMILHRDKKREGDVTELYGMVKAYLLKYRGYKKDWNHSFAEQMAELENKGLGGEELIKAKTELSEKLLAERDDQYFELEESLVDELRETMSRYASEEETKRKVRDKERRKMKAPAVRDLSYLATCKAVSQKIDFVETPKMNILGKLFVTNDFRDMSDSSIIRTGESDITPDPESDSTAREAATTPDTDPDLCIAALFRGGEPEDMSLKGEDNSTE